MSSKIDRDTVCVSCGDTYSWHYGDRCPNGVSAFVAEPKVLAVGQSNGILARMDVEEAELRIAALDCRQCKHYYVRAGHDACGMLCKGGECFVRAPALQLWRK